MKKGILLMTLALAVAFLSFTTKPHGNFNVDVSNSTVKWTGYHLAKSFEHSGNVNIKSGTLVMHDGAIVSGEFVLDMTSISNTDLEDTKKNAKLVGHLKSDDFFGVEKHPEAKLVIKTVVKSGDNYKATGDVTIRGITEPIEFEIKMGENTSDHVEATSVLRIDRTKHEIMYGWSLTNAMLGNEFQLEIKVMANK